MTITITALEGDPESGNFLLGMQIDFSALAMTEGNETTSATGTINIDIDTSDPLVSTSGRVMDGSTTTKRSCGR